MTTNPEVQLKQLVNGNITLYLFPDGHVSCAVGGTWLSVLFTSSEAALSWCDDWDGAERKFKEVNPPTGKGSNYVGIRQQGAHDLVGRALLEQARVLLEVARNGRRRYASIGHSICEAESS